MGTNFYIKKTGEHIGKRSVAGPYCWDCSTTLCMAGKDNIHNSTSPWHKTCPICDQPIITESLKESAAGRELGFNKSLPTRKTGVRSCSSFTWAIKKEILLKSISRCVQEPIIDEYEYVYTLDEFEAVLSECPIQFWDMIGKEFS